MPPLTLKRPMCGRLKVSGEPVKRKGGERQCAQISANARPEHVDFRAGAFLAAARP